MVHTFSFSWELFPLPLCCVYVIMLSLRYLKFLSTTRKGDQGQNKTSENKLSTLFFPIRGQNQFRKNVISLCLGCFDVPLCYVIFLCLRIWSFLRGLVLRFSLCCFIYVIVFICSLMLCVLPVSTYFFFSEGLDIVPFCLLSVDRCLIVLMSHFSWHASSPAWVLYFFFFPLYVLC